jgi:hypothetical protein
MLASYLKSRPAAFLLMIFLSLSFNAHAQSGNSTSITGTVLDPSGAVVANAKVEVSNPVSGFSRSAVTDAAGKFVIPNVPFNPYHVTVAGEGFAASIQDVDVRSTVPVNLSLTLKVAGSAESVTVEANGEDLLENTSTFHTGQPGHPGELGGGPHGFNFSIRGCECGTGKSPSVDGNSEKGEAAEIVAELMNVSPDAGKTRPRNRVRREELAGGKIVLGNTPFPELKAEPKVHADVAAAKEAKRGRMESPESQLGQRTVDGVER